MLLVRTYCATQAQWPGISSLHSHLPAASLGSVRSGPIFAIPPSWYVLRMRRLALNFTLWFLLRVLTRIPRKPIVLHPPSEDATGVAIRIVDRANVTLPSAAVVSQVGLRDPAMSLHPLGPLRGPYQAITSIMALPQGCWVPSFFQRRTCRCLSLRKIRFAAAAACPSLSSCLLCELLSWRRPQTASVCKEHTQ